MSRLATSSMGLKGGCRSTVVRGRRTWDARTNPVPEHIDRAPPRVALAGRGGVLFFRLALGAVGAFLRRNRDLMPIIEEILGNI